MNQFKKYFSEAKDVTNMKYDNLPDNVKTILKKLYLHNKITQILEKDQIHVSVNKFDFDVKDLQLLLKEKSFVKISKMFTDAKEITIMFEKEK